MTELVRDHACKGKGTGRTLPCADPACPNSPPYPRWTILSLESGNQSVYVRVWLGTEWSWLLAMREPLAWLKGKQ